MAERKTSGCDENCDELDFSSRTRFVEILPAEYEEIAERRKANGEETGAGKRPARLTGISLSGGGIRSATFNLGLLQALNEAGLLKCFDYLSTVSGGGYCGGWWSAWLARGSRTPKQVFPDPEHLETDRDLRRNQLESQDSRADYERSQVKDAAISAGIDPIHHLRLFSNFLTPRKGLLSGDTWRAIAVIGRNLLLTWLILLPIMLATIMLGQAFFAILPQTANGFRWRSDLNTYVTTYHTSGVIDPQDEVVMKQPGRRNAHDLPDRVTWALLIPALLLLGSIVCVALWMVANRRCWLLRDKIVVVLSGVFFAVLSWFLATVTHVGFLLNRVFLIAAGAWFVILAVILVIWQWKHKATAQDIDFWRNRLVLAQTRTLKWSVFSAVVLFFSAFGYEVIDFLLAHQTIRNTAADAAARAGGWGALIMAVLSSVYTATKASPTGGEDAKSKTAPPSLLQRIAFAIAPVLLLLVLGLVLAWIGHRLYTTVYRDDHEQVWFVIRGALISGILFLFFALYEFRPAQKWKSGIVIAIWLLIAVGQYAIPIEWIQPHLVTIGGLSAIAVAAGLLVRAAFSRNTGFVVAAAGIAALAAWVLGALEPVRFVLERSHVPQLVVGGILATLTLLIFELIFGKGGNTRSVSLIAFGFLMFVLVGVAACAGSTAWRALTMVGLISTILGWVLALGWLADPNSLTIHGFYKSRLVRAYMGASNDRRRAAKDSDISDAVPGDDVLLVDLQNTRQGAPYHLINTTLNLVGGSDLATQQRFSDFFIMSKRWCGSMRTGFRPTDEYACGTISLGTAVAVSGAAASPNMGAQSPSSALAALLTLFNVRLGYWAPTPNQSYWRTGSARLWPVYTLQEMLSQTTDLLPFSYLTDGGHFDNSGVYSLIQRGCNFVVFGDCGADPNVTLDDLGNLIRKVRIDFGTEIDLDIAQLRCQPPGSHFVVGTIRYSEVYARTINLPAGELEGTIIVVKPNRTAGAPVDVLQYGYTNDAFPQQSTADQWYDEAQFESYRALGYLSGRALVASGKLKEIC